MRMTEIPLRHLLSLCLLGLGLAGCAASPLPIGDQAIAAWGPAHVLSGDASAGDRVVWGGRITAIHNLPDHTEITLISYPLDRADRPRLGAEPGVRFLLRQEGFLEPVQYSPGRYLSVVGQIEGLRQSQLGEHWLELPVLAAEQIHLWPADRNQWHGPARFSIGIGIQL